MERPKPSPTGCFAESLQCVKVSSTAAQQSMPRSSMPRSALASNNKLTLRAIYRSVAIVDTADKNEPEALAELVRLSKIGYRLRLMETKIDFCRLCHRSTTLRVVFLSLARRVGANPVPSMTTAKRRPTLAHYALAHYAGWPPVIFRGCSQRSNRLISLNWETKPTRIPNPINGSRRPMGIAVMTKQM